MFGNPVQGPRIVPFGAARQASDKLPNGRPGFRVTQRYGDLDAFFRSRVHGATDVGNMYCGDNVVAMGDGTLSQHRDPNGALGVKVKHANGYTTEYWHVSRYIAAPGAIKRGQLIGSVGATGLDIGGCHLHFAVRNSSGALVDPWPLLDQNTTAYRVLKGTPINIRNGPNPDKYLFATGTTKGIIRTADKLNLGPWQQRMRYGGTVTGTDGRPWDRVYLNSAYRVVRSDLLLKG